MRIDKVIKGELTKKEKAMIVTDCFETVSPSDIYDKSFTMTGLAVECTGTGNDGEYTSLLLGTNEFGIVAISGDVVADKAVQIIEMAEDKDLDEWKFKIVRKQSDNKTDDGQPKYYSDLVFC